MKKSILFGIPTIDHVGICMDEVTGLQALGYDCHTTPYAAKKGRNGNSFLRVLTIIENAFMLVKKAYSVKPDLIYINSRIEVLGFLRDFITLVILRLFYWHQVPVAIKSHGSDIEVISSKSFIMRYLILPILKREVAAWLLLSAEEKRCIDQLDYFDPEHTYVTKNIVRVGQFEPNSAFRDQYGIPASSKILLFAGRMIAGKGIFQIIKAFAQLKDAHDVFLIMVGDGQDFDEIKHYVTEHNLQDRVLLTGWISEAAVVPFYANADMLVFPTNLPEGFAMCLFNSVAAGLAVVTSPVRAAVDYLKAPENCVWVDPTSTESVSSAIHYVLSDEEFMQQMRKNNKEKGVDFCQASVCKELEAALTAVLYPRKRRPAYLPHYPLNNQ